MKGFTAAKIENWKHGGNQGFEPVRKTWITRLQISTHGREVDK